MKNPYINDDPCGEISDSIESLKAAIVNYSLKHRSEDVIAMPLCIINTIVESLANYEEKARRLENIAHAYLDLTAAAPQQSFDLCRHLLRPLDQRVIEPVAIEGTNIVKLVKK